jgi:hypothetical protein
MYMRQQIKLSGFAALGATLLMLAGLLPVPAQTAVDGAIGGTVNDSTGSAIAGASVMVRNNATNATETVVTDGAGVYRAIQLHGSGEDPTGEPFGDQAFIRALPSR